MHSHTPPTAACKGGSAADASFSTFRTVSRVSTIVAPIPSCLGAVGTVVAPGLFVAAMLVGFAWTWNGGLASREGVGTRLSVDVPF